jgi:hypothetical protein
MKQIDRQDTIVYGALGLSMLALLLFRGGDLLDGINQQSLISRTAQQTAKDDAIAQRRFSLGCNTGFLVNGVSVIDTTAPAVDIRTRRLLPINTVVCTETGTAIVGNGGYLTDIRTSATVRRKVQERGFLTENNKLRSN